MRRELSGVYRAVAVLTVLMGAAGRASAGPLNPLDFASLGAFPTAGGTYYFNTTGPNPTFGSVTGVIYDGIAVFDFNSINVTASQNLIGFGSLPVAFLSRGDVTINGTINVSATSQIGAPGPGGFSYASGPGAGGSGGYTDPTSSFSDPGGGGFGGRGGNGSSGYQVSQVPPVWTVVPGGGGPGGSSYGNLAVSLQGGSGGGSSSSQVGDNNGGSGGGAIEIGAIGKISVGGSILANGSSGGDFGGGGGSGGGILLNGNSVTLSSSAGLSAQGGDGSEGGGGGGGGGRVLILTGSGPFSGDPDSINVSGGSGGPIYPPYPPGFTDAGGQDGVIDINTVPEPASLVLLGIGLLGVLGYAHHAGRRAAA